MREGATALEYVLIAAMVSIAIVAGILSLRDALIGNYDTVSTQVDAATAS